MHASGTNLPRFVRDLLASPPQRGGGLHNWLFRAARVLHPYRTAAEITQLLGALTAGQPVKPGEIEDAVKNSESVAWNPDEQTATPRAASPTWPSVNREQREAIIAKGGGLADLWEASPRRFEDNDRRTEEIIDLLFPGNPLLCVGKSSRVFTTATREELRGTLAGLALIVPSPMTAPTGITQDGKESAHTLASTGPRRFLVIEQDKGTTDEQAAILLHLAERGPMALALHSGGKSVHGWFTAAGQGENRLRRFMAYAVSLGADPALWTRSQFCRMPDGTRENGNRQTVYFMNPEVMP
jgi:hypothetical protein